MARYHEAMANRMNRRGGIAYDPYNGTDHDRCLPSITASYGIVGRVGTTLIFEDDLVNDAPSNIEVAKPKSCIMIACDRKSGFVRAEEGDSIGITFAVGGKAHNVVSKGVSRTITTMCDHDIGVICNE